MVDCCPKAEFVEYDEAISAPERDTDATAFELDPSCLAPQVLPGTAPELSYGNPVPEFYSRRETSVEDSTDRVPPKSTDCVTSKSTDRVTSKSIIWRIRILVAVVVVVIVAIGGGVGVRMRHTGRKITPISDMEPSITTFTVTRLATPTVSTSSAPLGHLTTNATSTASSLLSPPTHTSTPSAASPAYATLICSYHLQEWNNCDPPDDLFAIVNLVDNDSHDIGDTYQFNTSGKQIGASINNDEPYSFTSKLPHFLRITGEHENDYVQFSYGSLPWTSNTTIGPAACRTGVWSPEDGPICNTESNHTFAERQMDCSFPC